MLNFDQQPRYRLALLASLHPQLFDVKVKESWIKDPQVLQFFADRGILYTQDLPIQDLLEESLAHRFAMTIDGASHANREWVFFLGACQFFHRAQFEAYSTTKGLVAWRHYVPVAADLSDLV